MYDIVSVKTGAISVREVAKLIAFILLIIGTAGLLVNELIFDWGRIATIVFACLNATGLFILAFTYLRAKKQT